MDYVYVTSVIGIIGTFILALVGAVVPPILTKVLRRVLEHQAYVLFVGLSAGLCLSTGLVHSLAGGFEGFSSAADGSTEFYYEFPYAALIALIVMASCMLVEYIVRTVLSKIRGKPIMEEITPVGAEVEAGAAEYEVPEYVVNTTFYKK